MSCQNQSLPIYKASHFKNSVHKIGWRVSSTSSVFSLPLSFRWKFRTRERERESSSPPLSPSPNKQKSELKSMTNQALRRNTFFCVSFSIFTVLIFKMYHITERPYVILLKGMHLFFHSPNKITVWPRGHKAILVNKIILRSFYTLK